MDKVRYRGFSGVVDETWEKPRRLDFSRTRWVSETEWFFENAFQNYTD